MKLQAVCAAALLAVSAVGVQAENLSSLVPLVPGSVLGQFSAAFGDTHSFGGLFTDTFTFTPPVGVSLVGGGLMTFDFPLLAAHDIDFLSADLNGIPFSLSPNGVFETGTVTGVTAGLLVLTVHGKAGGTLDDIPVNASYSGTINIDPVPEPGTIALMLAGLGAVGALVRRRRAD